MTRLLFLGFLALAGCTRSRSVDVSPTPEDPREAIASSLEALMRAELEYSLDHHTFTADLQTLRAYPHFRIEPGVQVTIHQAGPLGWAASGSHPRFPERDCVQWWAPQGGIVVPLTRRDRRRGDEQQMGRAVCDALEPREPVPLCEAAPRAPLPFTERFTIGPGSSSAFRRLMDQQVWPYRYSSDSVLDAAITSLRDSGFGALDSADAVEVARTIAHESDAMTRVALAVFRLLDVDPKPLMTAVGDYTLSPRTRLVVLRSLDQTRTDSALVDGVLTSLCQLSGWLIGSRSEEHFTDWLQRLDFALTEQGEALYEELFRYVHTHWDLFLMRAHCTNLEECLGPVRWAYEDLLGDPDRPR